VPEFSERTGQKDKTIRKQIERGIFEKQNPGWLAVRGADRVLIFPVPPNDP